MAVLRDRQGEPCLVAGRGLEAVHALHDVPAIVLPTGVMQLVVHLFPEVLADVPDVEVAVQAIEAEPPRIPEPIVPGLSLRADL